MSFNPAYTGTRGMLSAVGLYRTQWVGLPGAPETLNFSVQAPVGKKVGLGLNINSDKIFIANETNVDLMFSYQLDVGQNANLSLGLKAGLNLFNIDFNRANVGPNDQNDINADIANEIAPQIGVGAFYYTETFYTGLSVPNLLKTDHFNDVQRNVKTERLHLYYMVGNVFELNPDLKFKPSGLLKVVSGAPLQVDVSANFLLYEKVTLGMAYRWDAGINALAAFQISDKLLIGYGYDWETTQLSQYNNGSHEIFLRFELISKRNKILSPRFF